MLSTGTNLKYNNDTYSNGFSDPYGASSDYTDEMCAYATGASVPPEWVDGKYGQAVSLNGSTHYVKVTNHSSLKLSALDLQWRFGLNRQTSANYILVVVARRAADKCVFSFGSWQIQRINTEISLALKQCKMIPQ